MSEDKHEIKVVRYINHQIRQTSDEKVDFPHILQDTTDYFPYESIHVKSSEEAPQYMQDTLSDFSKIYPNAVCDRDACIHFLITDSSLRVIISCFMDDEELPNTDHVYTYVYSAVYFEECE